MGDQDRALTHAKNFEPHYSVGCHSPPKNGVHALSFMPHPISPLIADRMLQKVSLIVFRQILPDFLPLVYIFSFIMPNYLKNLIEIKSLSIEQCPPELSP